ncbi:DNA methyltransferase [Methylorubrum populi]
MSHLAHIRAVDQVVTDQYAIFQGDACELIQALPTGTVHFGIHSPPFEGLYKFSNYDRDLSNSEGDDFWRHYGFLIAELLRVTVPGRLHSVHVMQLPTSKIRHGHIGMRDFRGETVRAYEAAGWIFHSEVCVWKDPVVAQQRTKSIRLLHKQVLKDSSLSGQGLADYILTFRKPGENPEPIDGPFDAFCGADLDISREAYERQAAAHRAEGKAPWPYEQWASILVWQRYASPVWMDVDQTRTLQNKRWNPAARDERDEADEQHISPLQLDVIERCIDLWSAPGDTVLTPFLGIGSEVWAAVNMGRRGVGFELKPTYFRQAARNLAAKPAREVDPTRTVGFLPLIEAAE